MPHIDILILSDEDLRSYPDELERYIGLTSIVVLTRGAQGAILFQNGTQLESVAYSVTEVDPTGAGDVFATAFLINYYQSRSVKEGTEFRTLCRIFRCRRGWYLLYTGTGTGHVEITDVSSRKLSMSSFELTRGIL